MPAIKDTIRIKVAFGREIEIVVWLVMYVRFWDLEAKISAFEANTISLRRFCLKLPSDRIRSFAKQD